MMYFKNNWNAGPFPYFMDFLEEKKTYIFICNFKSHFLHTQAFSDILKLSTSHAVNKKAFSNGSKSVEDEKKSFLNHFNLSKKSGDDISI
jgi:hypothetical protein